MASASHIKKEFIEPGEFKKTGVYPEISSDYNGGGGRRVLWKKSPIFLEQKAEEA